MALKLLNLQTIIEKQLIRQTPLLTTLRFGHRLRGKPPGVAKTLEQRLNGKFFAYRYFMVMFYETVLQMKKMLIQRLTEKSTLVFHSLLLSQNPKSVKYE